MKTSLEWLSDFLPGSLSVTDAAEALTLGGLPVEVIQQHGSDTIIDVEVTSNRRDCLCHLGVARELAALLDRPFKEPVAALAPSKPLNGLSISIEAAEVCPHYCAFIIRNVKIGPSPAWLKRRLEAVGARSINNVVDVTNYVMFELGQPLHAFDLDKIGGSTIHIRAAAAGEKLTTIDGHVRELTPSALVIADAMKPLALAGVMGGRDSEVTESTTSILLEAARFDALSVRNTARRLSLKSESSYRFERGIDPTLPRRAGWRAAQLIAELAGGTLEQAMTEAGTHQFEPKTLTLRITRLERLLGVSYAPDVIIQALSRAGLQPKALSADSIAVTVPSWRSDITLEVDLIEEVARLVGYESIPTTDRIEVKLVPPQPVLKTLDQINDILLAAGFFEAITVTFVSDLLATAFLPADQRLQRADALVRKADAQLRPSLLAGLLEALVRNASVGNRNTRLYESGSTFVLNNDGLVHETRRIAFVSNDPIRIIRGVVESLLNRLDPTRSVEVVSAARTGFAPSACGSVLWSGEIIGQIGQIDPAVCEKVGLSGAHNAAELDLAKLLAGAKLSHTLSPLPRYPAIERDLSLVVSETVTFTQLKNLILQLNLPDLQVVEFAGSYSGKPLAAGTKSLTVSLVFRSLTSTLVSESVDQSVQTIISSSKTLGATVRG